MNSKLLAAVILTGMANQASGFEVDTKSADWAVRFDIQVKYNLAVRAKEQDPRVLEQAGAGGNFASDPDYSFDRGDIISNRVDLLLDFDAVWKDTAGFRISGASWYDDAYRGGVKFPLSESLNFSNALTLQPGELSDAEEDLHYWGGEILDAFAFLNWDIGDVAGNLRAGQHTIYWGQSLLGTGAINSVGGAMNPLDFSKSLAVPGSEAKELFRPTSKLSTLMQLSDNLSMEAYFSVDWENYRLPRGNTFFSPAAGFTDDIELVHLTDGLAFHLLDDERPDDGEWGINFSYYFEKSGLEVSAYYLNYHDKVQNGLVTVLNNTGGAVLGASLGLPVSVGALAVAANDPQVSPVDQNVAFDVNGNPIGILGSAKWTYKEDIDLFGLSFSKQVAGLSLGMDITHRRDAPLRPDLNNILGRSLNVLSGGSGFTTAQFNAATSTNYAHATGDTWHLVVNAIGTLRDNGLWEGGGYIVEATFNMLDNFTDDNLAFLVSQETRNAAGEVSTATDIKENDVMSHIAFSFNPVWYQVRPGVDLKLLTSIAYGIDGFGVYSFSGDEKSGSGSIGLEASVNETWTATIRYNDFFGPVPNSFANYLKDRDNYSFTIKRTF